MAVLLAVDLNGRNAANYAANYAAAGRSVLVPSKLRDGAGKVANPRKAAVFGDRHPVMQAERSTKVERLASHHGAIALKVSAKSSKLIAVNKPLASPCMKKGRPGADFTAALRAGCETMGI